MLCLAKQAITARGDHFYFSEIISPERNYADLAGCVKSTTPTSQPLDAPLAEDCSLIENAEAFHGWRRRDRHEIRLHVQ